MARRKGRSLGRSEVVAAAQACVAEEGADALNVNRVAARLGIRTPSLYNHVDGADDLRRAVAFEVVKELAALSDPIPQELAEPRALLGWSAHVARTYALEKPHLYSFLMAVPISWDEAPFNAYWPRMMAPLAESARKMGVPEARIPTTVRYLISAISGYIRLEIRGAFGSGPEVAQSFDWMIDRLYASLKDPGALN